MIAINAYINALQGPILVIGAGGFVGANLFKLVNKYRNDVFAVVRSGKGWRLDEVKDEQIIQVDFNDYSAVKNLVNTSL